MATDIVQGKLTQLHRNKKIGAKSLHQPRRAQKEWWQGKNTTHVCRRDKEECI